MISKNSFIIHKKKHFQKFKNSNSFSFEDNPNERKYSSIQNVIFLNSETTNETTTTMKNNFIMLNLMMMTLNFEKNLNSK